MNRTERLFAIAEYLRGRRTGTTAAQIAERFDVTLRTVYRDLDALRAAQLPVQAERGRGGGLMLDRAYTLPPVSFSPREAAVLVAAAAYLTNMRMMPWKDTLRGAADKVRAALDLSKQRQMLAELDAVHFLGIPQPEAAPGVREAVERAWFEHQPLTIVYRGKDGLESKRRVRIVKVLIDRSETRLLVHDLDKDAPRELKLHAIVEAI